MCIGMQVCTSGTRKRVGCVDQRLSWLCRLREGTRVDEDEGEDEQEDEGDAEGGPADNWLCPRLYIGAPEEDMFSVVHEGKHKTTFFFCCCGNAAYKMFKQ